MGMLTLAQPGMGVAILLPRNPPRPLHRLTVVPPPCLLLHLYTQPSKR